MDDYLQRVRDMFVNAETFTQTKNYYFEKHVCGEGETKTEMNTIITDDITHKTLRVGFCADCRTMFYTECKRERSLL